MQSIDTCESNEKQISSSSTVLPSCYSVNGMILTVVKVVDRSTFHVNLKVRSIHQVSWLWTC